MSETELREALRAIVDPAMFDGNYVRSDWLPRWREAHDHARRLLDIPAKPEQADPWNGHEWMQREQDRWAFCRVCGTVRRADDKNKPCRGPVRIGLRAEPEHADEVARLDLSDEQAAILRKHLASRQQTVSEFFGDVLMDMGLGRVAGRDYPGAVRLVPVRDGGPTRGEQIIRENAEIAGSNPATALFPPRDDTP